MQSKSTGDWYMALELHRDFKDFLKLLISHDVRYLLVGGYAVGFYGYPRATADMDIWIEVSDENALKMNAVMSEFGIGESDLSPSLFLEKDKVIRMGVPPVRLEILTGVSGVAFEECYTRRRRFDIDTIPVDFISLDDLKKNKKASGRHKDLEDLEHLSLM
jgi:predicted nucleotidyltransferase